MSKFRLRIENSFGLEIWKDIEEYEGLYQASTLGRIKSIRTGTEKILKPRVEKDDYLRVALSINGVKKYKYIHSIVADTFLFKSKDTTEINHRITGAEGKQRNEVENLEWVSHKTNNVYDSHQDKVWETRKKTLVQYDKNMNVVKEWNSICEMNRVLGFNRGMVRKSCEEKNLFKDFYWRLV